MRKRILITICFLAVALIINSCLKDDVGLDWTSSLKGKMYAEIPSHGSPAFVIQPVASDQIFKFLVNIATDALPTSDITLKFKIDPTAMEAFSDATQAADTSIHWRYMLYPGVTILDSIATIKAGTRNTYIHVRLQRADTLTLSHKFMAPVTLYNATGGNGNVVIASNKNSILYKLPIANKWEGKYAMSGYILRAGDPVLSGFYSNRVYTLGTSGANSVTFNDVISWAGNNGKVGGVGPWTINISEASVPNPILSITDDTNSAVTMNPAYPNRYDPATKTFYISVYWGTGPTNRATTDTLVYVGPAK